MFVRIKDADDAVNIARICSSFNCNVDAEQGSRSCDAKSLLGLMALGRDCSVNIIVHCSEEGIKKEYQDRLIDFIA